MSTADVDTVATDEDLAGELLGLEALENLRPNDWSDCKPARQAAFDKVLDGLRGHTPPVREADLSDVTELRLAVIYGALAQLYFAGITSGDPEAVYTAKHRHYRDEFRSAVNSLRPTVGGGAQIAAPASIRVHRA